MDRSLPQMHTVLLVVYGVLWAASTPSFARLRAFAFNDIVVRGRRTQAWWRLVFGLMFGNAGPVALLILLLKAWPRAVGAWGVAEGALAGISVAVFPRLLHAFTASNELGHTFHSDRDYWEVLKGWDPVWAEERRGDGANGFLTHLLAAVIVFTASAGVALVIGWTAT